MNQPDNKKKKFKIIGTPRPKLDANVRVNGQAVYGQDISLPNMLHGAILRAAHPVAEIVSINTSQAKNMPGVICVIAAEDAKTAKPLDTQKLDSMQICKSDIITWI